MLQPLNILYQHIERDLNETRVGQMCLSIGMSCLPPASPFQSNIFTCLGIATGYELL